VQRIVRFILNIFLLAILPTSLAIAQSDSRTVSAGTLAVSDSGSLYYLGSFSSEKDLAPRSGICGAFGLVGKPPVALSEVTGKASPSRCEAVVDVVAGSRQFEQEDMLFRPFKITTDSKNRAIVADQARFPSIHIFDFARHKHLRIAGGLGERLQAPAGLAVDGHDQLYVTDAQLGAILIYQSNGKFLRYIGNPKGERLFERPAGIAVDPASGHIYVADPPRNIVIMLDANGNLLAKFGTGAAGSGPNEFAAPTDVVVRSQELFVLDSQNNRIQILDLAGNLRASIYPESMGASFGFSIDSRGRIYLDGPLHTVQVFDSKGRLLLRFGSAGSGPAEFNGPSAICTDGSDRIYVADTGNNRVQSFEWGAKHVTKLPHP